MFTGLIEEVGKVKAVRQGGRSAELTIACRAVLADARIGDSIAVNGVCLTVTKSGPGWFSADAVPETMARTTLGQLRPGDPVNLERTMAAGSRFGGHIVQGHVDGVGTIQSLVPEEASVRVTIAAPAAVMRYIVEKGSVAVDGISLTVAAVAPGAFSVALIPHTLAVTTMGKRKPGDQVNLEADILGKYIDHLLAVRFGGAPAPAAAAPGTTAAPGPGLTLQKLAAHGFTT